MLRLTSWNPLVPSVQDHIAILDADVDTGLQQGLLAGIAIDADPGRGVIRRGGIATARHLGLRDRDGAAHAGEAGVDEHGTAPVEGVRGLGPGVRVRCVDGWHATDRPARTAVSDGPALGMLPGTGAAEGGAHGGQGAAGEEDLSQDGGLHDGQKALLEN